MATLKLRSKLSIAARTLAQIATWVVVHPALSTPLESCNKENAFAKSLTNRMVTLCAVVRKTTTTTTNLACNVLLSATAAPMMNYKCLLFVHSAQMTLIEIAQI